VTFTRVAADAPLRPAEAAGLAPQAAQGKRRSASGHAPTRLGIRERKIAVKHPATRLSRLSRRRRQSRARMLGRLLSFVWSLALIGLIGIGLLYLYLRTETLPAAHVMQTSQILDANGNLIDAVHAGENRQVVPLGRISPYAVQATLAIEDRRFYEHFGIDPKGLARAVVVNLLHMDKVQGASTITQQLARNLYLSHERTWDRKIREAIISLQLEMQYSKDEILERYLNQIYYGHATYGIQAASRLYFGKDAADLTLGEAALLAGIPKGPRYYSPYYDERNARERQRLVLNAMVENGFITREEAEAAYAEPLELMPLRGDAPSEAPYFRDYIRQLAFEKIGLDERLFEEGGLRIYTTLDMRMQRIAEKLIADHLAGTELQAALIALDPRSGHIKAMVGGRDYAENQYNRVFATTRQPGSAFKPFVYLTALQQDGFTALTTFESKPTAFVYDEGRRTYRPNNFGGKYFGVIDMGTAIAKSDNIYAVNTIMAVGPQRVIDTARALGITGPLEPVPSLALGTSPVSPFEMAAAFGVLANQGVRVEPTAIVRIEDAQGNVLYEAAPKREQAVPAEPAYILTKLMEGVFDPGGTGARVAGTLRRPVAAKTGTTNWDSWMVGYTPELSAAVWVGHDRGRAISAVESIIAAPIFAEFMEQSLAPIPPKIFPIPPGVVNVYVDPETGALAGADCPEARLTPFVRGTEPTAYCAVHGEPVPAPDETPAPAARRDRSWWDDLRRWWTGQ
jgi:1A family penicillin-binding protein